MGYSPVHRHFGKPTRLETFSKNALIILNTIFVVFGFILFVYGCGGKASTNRDSYSTITENGGDMFQITSNVLIFLGTVLLVIGLWGLFGIHTCMKACVYISLLLLLVFIDIGISFYSSSIEAHAKHSVELNLVHSLQKLKTAKDPSEPSIVTLNSNWNALQSELRCCGVHEYRDWFVSSPIAQRRIDLIENAEEDNTAQKAANGTNTKSPGGFVAVSYPDSEDIMRIPHTCFKNGDDGLIEEDFNTPVSTETILENVYTDGCLGKTVNDLDIDRMQRVGILMAVSKILAVMCAITLTCHFRNDKMLSDIGINYV